LEYCWITVGFFVDYLFFPEFLMSVRATDSLIAEVVIAPSLPNSPKMIVQTVNQEAKLITTIWFSASQEVQIGVFPSGALDRYESAPAKAKAAKPQAASASGAPKKRGRKPKK
jgi:hypothetical protein